MCLAMPARITEIRGPVAIVDLDGVTLEANVVLIDDPRVGDYVMVHAGFAIQKYDPQEAEATLALLRQAGERAGLR